MEVKFLRTNQALVGFKQDSFGPTGPLLMETWNNLSGFSGLFLSFEFSSQGALDSVSLVRHHRLLQHRHWILVFFGFSALLFTAQLSGYWLFSSVVFLQDIGFLTG